MFKSFLLSYEKLFREISQRAFLLELIEMHTDVRSLNKFEFIVRKLETKVCNDQNLSAGGDIVWSFDIVGKLFLRTSLQFSYESGRV